MSFRVAIRSRARDDIHSARDWYEERSPGLGSRFGAEVDAVMLSIGERPLIYAKIHHDVRRATTRRFPYAVYFIVEGQRVAVLRVLHQARDPREWQAAR
jgi:plasmid stabilization system protein ParE